MPSESRLESLLAVHLRYSGIFHMFCLYDWILKTQNTTRRTLRTTICYSNRIKANKSYAVSYLFLLVLLAGDVQLNPGPGLASASVGAPVDGAAGLLPRQRVEFPTLDDTGSISCILPGVLADFRSLSTGEDGAWRGDLNVQLCDVGGTAKRAERPTSAVEGLTRAGATVDGKLALASALNRSVNSAGWRRRTTVPDKQLFPGTNAMQQTSIHNDTKFNSNSQERHTMEGCLSAGVTVLVGISQHNTHRLYPRRLSQEGDLVSVSESGLGESALQRGNFRRILMVCFNKGIPSGLPSL
ncbi:unnamed protein product [Leuciscus chuanchicus]